MAEQYDGFLRIQTILNVKDVSNQLKILANDAEKVKEKIKALQEEIKSMENDKRPTTRFKMLQEDLTRAEAKLREITDNFNLTAQDFRNNGDWIKLDQFDDAKQKIKDIKAEMDRLKAEGKDYNTGADREPQAYKEMQRQLAEEQSILNTINARRQEIIRSHEAEIVSRIKTITSQSIAVIKQGINIVSGLLRGFVSATTKMFSLLGNTLAGKLVSPLKNFVQHGQSGLDVVEKLTKRIWGLAKRVFIFTVITRALRAFRTGITDANDAWKELDKTSLKVANDIRKAFQGWQDEIVTSFAPLLNIIIPRITEGINKITETTRLFGQFVSGMTGSDVYERMARGAEEYDEALGDVNKDQKKTQKGLAGFDKLDVLNGGNKGATKEIDKITDGVQKLIDLLKNGQYFDFGSEIARRMEESLEKIQWGPIREKATKAGAAFSQIVNGIFSRGGLAEQAGRNVAGGLNVITGALDGFFSHFRGRNFGKFFADIFKGLSNAIDFKTLKRTITNGGTQIIEVYRGFWENMKQNASKFGEGFADIFNGIFADINFSTLIQGFKEKIQSLSEFLYSAATNIEWGKVAKNINNAIDNLIKGQVIDKNGELKNVWKENGKAVGKVIGNFLNTVSDIIQNTNFEELGHSIGDWLNAVFSNIDPGQLGRGIGALVKGVFNMIKGLFEKINGEDFGKAFTEFYNGLDVDGIKQAFAGMVKEVMGTIGDAIKASPELREAIGTLLGLIFQIVFVKILMLVHPLLGIIVGVLIAVGDLLVPIVQDLIYKWFKPIGAAVRGMIASLFRGDLITASINAIIIAAQPLVNLLLLITKLIDGIAGTDLSEPFSKITKINEMQASAAISGGAQWRPIQAQQVQWSQMTKDEMKAAFGEALSENADTTGNSGINTVILDVNGQQLAEATLDNYTSAIQRRGLKAEAILG